MEWIQFRSRSDPAFWVPVALGAAVVLCAGIAAQIWADALLSRIENLSATDPDTAVAEAAELLRSATLCFALALAALGLLLARYFSVARACAQLPPEGWWSIGAYRRLEGEGARKIAAAGVFVSWVLVFLSPMLVLAVEHLLDVLQADA